MQKTTGIKIRIFSMTLLAITLFPSLSVAQDSKVRTDSIKAEFNGYPVNPFGRTLFSIKARIGPYSAENRAKTITEIIRALAADPFFKTDSLLIIHEEGDINIVFGSQVITSVTPADSKAESKPADLIAFERHKQISGALQQHIEQNSEAGLFKSVIYSGIILVLLIIFIFLVNKLHKFFDKKILEAKSGLLSKIKIRDYQVIPVQRQMRFLHILNVAAKYVLIVLMFFTALWLTSYLLPWTKVYSLIFLRFILTPIRNFLDALWQFIPNLLTIMVIVFITTVFMVMGYFNPDAISAIIEGIFHQVPENRNRKRGY